MIKAIIIDDEVHCLDTLSILLSDYCPEVQVIERCLSARRGHPDNIGYYLKGFGQDNKWGNIPGCFLHAYARIKKPSTGWRKAALIKIPLTIKPYPTFFIAFLLQPVGHAFLAYTKTSLIPVRKCL